MGKEQVFQSGQSDLLEQGSGALNTPQDTLHQSQGIVRVYHYPQQLKCRSLKASEFYGHR